MSVSLEAAPSRFQMRETKKYKLQRHERVQDRILKTEQDMTSLGVTKTKNKTDFKLRIMLTDILKL